MSCSHLSISWSSSTLASSASSTRRRSTPRTDLVVRCSLRELRSHIDSVRSTQKIVEAMKLVAAAKVRRAQEAVVSSRPFSEALVEVLYNMRGEIQMEDIDLPLTRTSPVRKVALVVLTGECGLCGSFNNNVLKKADTRMEELEQLGLQYTVISVGKKGNAYFRRRPYIPLERDLEVNGVELLYSKFVSLVRSNPII
jgi:F-type H+-transporting ATPase subunit gamma